MATAKPKIPAAALPALAIKAAPPAPDPIEQATIRHLAEGYTVTTGNRFGNGRMTAHSTLAGALAELTRAMTPPAKAGKSPPPAA